MDASGYQSVLLASENICIKMRKNNAYELPRLCESPFKQSVNDAPDGTDEEKELPSGHEFHRYGLKTYPTRRPWSDLLLDISMTTAFNSLTNGTQVLDRETVVSYLSFFILVWWIWAAQVCYDVRFTKADWVHRLSVFLQFIVFCALAAFTKDFDIGYQLSSDASVDQQTIRDIQSRDGFSDERISAAQFRENQLPIMNARGISLVMMFSRLLLLSQYLLAIYLASDIDSPDSRLSPFSRFWKASTSPRFRAFQTHILSLILSASFYFIAFIILESSIGQSKGAQVAKIILWYLPVAIEICAHFIALTQRGFVQYPGEGMFERSSAAFIIVLGGGLDSITEGFQVIAGNVTIGKTGVGLILAGAIIFIVQFSLYFEMAKDTTIKKKRFGYGRRVFAWFIAHFIYFSSLIIMLQATAALLKFGNVSKALNVPLQFLAEANSAIVEAGDGQPISVDLFTNITANHIKELGLDLDDLVNIVNGGVVLGRHSNSSVLDPADSDLFGTPALQVAHNAVLQTTTVLIAIVLINFELTPEPDSLLESRIDLFLDVEANDTTTLPDTFDNVWYAIAEDAFVTEAHPALWFYGSASSTVASLSILGLIEWWGKFDVYRGGIFSIRLAVGILTCLLSLVDINHNKEVLGATSKDSTTFMFRISGSTVWDLASNSLLIPIFSGILVCEQVMELTLLFILRRNVLKHVDDINDPDSYNGHECKVYDFAQGNCVMGQRSSYLSPDL